MMSTAYSEKLALDRKRIIEASQNEVEFVRYAFPGLIQEIRQHIKDLNKDDSLVTDDDLVFLLKDVVTFEFVPREGWSLGVAMRAEDLINERSRGRTKPSL